MWALLFYLPTVIPFIQNLQHPQTSPATQPTSLVPDFYLPQPVVLTIGGICLLGAIAATLYALAKASQTIRKNGEAVSRSASKTITPLVAKHKTLSQKQKRQLSRRVLFYCRLALCVAPAMIPLGTLAIKTPVPAPLIICVATGLGFVSLLTLTLYSWLQRADSAK